MVKLLFQPKVSLRISGDHETEVNGCVHHRSVRFLNVLCRLCPYPYNARLKVPMGSPFFTIHSSYLVWSFTTEVSHGMEESVNLSLTGTCNSHSCYSREVEGAGPRMFCSCTGTTFSTSLDPRILNGTHVRGDGRYKIPGGGTDPIPDQACRSSFDVVINATGDAAFQEGIIQPDVRHRRAFPFQVIRVRFCTAPMAVSSSPLE